MEKNGYNQNTPGEKTAGKFSDVVIKRMMMSGGGVRYSPRKTTGEESLKMVMEQKDL
jgi:hypothetical protein